MAMSANPMLLNQILDMGMGFEFEDIQTALMVTNNESAEAAINYLLTHPSGGPAAGGGSGGQPNGGPSGGVPSQPSEPYKPPIEALRERVADMHIKAGDAVLTRALEHSRDNVDQALEWIMHQVSSRGSITSLNDVEAVKKKLEEDAEKRRAEREEEDRKRVQAIEEQMRAEEERERKKVAHEKRVEETRRRNEALLARKKKEKEQERKQRLLKWHKKHDAYREKDARVAQKSGEKRRQMELDIHNPDQAISMLFDRYGEDMGRNSLKLVYKVIDNVVKHPTEEKFRRLKLTSNRKLHNLIETPIGAFRLLEFVGFERETDPKENEVYGVLTEDKIVLTECQDALKLIEPYLRREPTVVAPLIDDLFECKDMGAEDVYCALVTLREMVRNLLISPASEHLLYANMDDAVFKARLGRFKPMLRILRKAGYHKNLQHRTFKFAFDPSASVPVTSAAHPQIRLLKALAEDLGDGAARALPETPVGKAVLTVKKSNGAVISPLFNTLARAVDRILEQPLEMKYQSLSMDKLKQKYPRAIGIASVLKALGFRRKEQNTYAVDVQDLDLLRLRKDMLVRCAAAQQ